MGDSWEYTVLWEFAGLTPPNLHEDQLQSIIDTLNAVSTGIYAGSDAVTTELGRVERSGISSVAFSALYDRWHSRGAQALVGLANTLASLQTGLGNVLVEIYEWKARLVVSVGLADMGLTIEYVATGGLAALANHVGLDVARTEVRRRLESLLDDLEAKLLGLVVDGTPLKSLQGRIEKELQAVVNEVIASVGSTAGHLVGGT